MAQSTVGVRLDTNTQERLKRLGEIRDRSPHYLMKEAVETFLAKEEAFEAEYLILHERWKAFELTGETISNEDMKAWVKTLGKRDGSK